MNDEAAPGPMVAGVELGGTKLCLVVGRGREVLDSARLPTEEPKGTLGAAAEVLARWRDQYQPQALGIASFGPIAIDRQSPDYGRMLATPKPGWAGADVLGGLAAGFGRPVALHTDVTAAALAEGRWGAARGLDDHVYVTVGTGIGMGLVAGGRPITGLMHPEAGHVRVRRMAGDPFPGFCPFHGDCLEGLTAGPAVLARWGVDASSFPPDVRDTAFEILASYIAQMAYTVVLTTGAERLVLGGGVTLAPGLLERVRAALPALANGYGPAQLASGDPRDLLVAPAIAGSSGVTGALALAADLVRADPAA